MPQQPSLPRPSDRWIPWYFVGFFCSLVLVLVPMCIIAVRTNSGVVTEHAYEKGLAYNKAIEADAQQKSLNWKGDVVLTPNPNGKTAADFTLLDDAGHPLDQATVSLWLVRPTQNGMDKKFDMQATDSGHYHTELDLPAQGLWEARISVMRMGRNYQITKRIVIP